MDLSLLVLLVFLGLSGLALIAGGLVAMIGLCQGHTVDSERHFDPALGIWR